MVPVLVSQYKGSFSCFWSSVAPAKPGRSGAEHRRPPLNAGLGSSLSLNLMSVAGGSRRPQESNLNFVIQFLLNKIF